MFLNLLKAIFSKKQSSEGIRLLSNNELSYVTGAGCGWENGKFVCRF